MKLTINRVSVCFNNKPKEFFFLDKDACVSEYTVDNPKLVDYYYYDFEDRETFTGVVKDKSGTIAHYVNGKIHRDNGPPVEYRKGKRWYKEWFMNNRLHRDNGPAVEDISGHKAWWFNGEHYGYSDDYTNESWIAKVATLKGMC